MKLGRYAKLAKRFGYVDVIRMESGEIWLGTPYSVYKAVGLPDMRGTSQVMTVLDIDAKAMEKIRVKETECESVRDIHGLNLIDDPEQDIKASRFQIAAVKNGALVACLLCEDGELVFYDDSLLAPLVDVFKESDYVETTVRVDDRGIRYVVVRDGFDVLAAVMPRKIVDKEFLADLQDFQGRCTEQYFKDEARAARLAELQAEAEAAAGEQESIGEGEEND